MLAYHNDPGIKTEIINILEAHRKNPMDDKLPHRTGAIIEKNRFNRDRADHKLTARAAGGKRY